MSSSETDCVYGLGYFKIFEVTSSRCYIYNAKLEKYLNPDLSMTKSCVNGWYDSKSVAMTVLLNYANSIHPSNLYIIGSPESIAFEEGYKAGHTTPCGYQPDMSNCPEHMLYGSRV